MLSDKQLLQLTKTELLAEYRKLESKLQEVSTNTKEPTLEDAIKIVQDNDMIVRKKQQYNFQGGMNMDKPIIEPVEPTLTEIARLVARRDELQAGLPMYDAQYMQHVEAYARVLNELYDINSKLKEVGLQYAIYVLQSLRL